MEKTNVILIGMPSAGKSTVGRPLADKLAMKFADTDEIILKQEKRPLKDIVNTDGLGKFLDIQEQAILSLNEENCVISTGGSAIYSEPAMRHLKTSGMVIYLQIPFDELENRITPGRRFARHEGQSFRELYDERIVLYEKYADYTINCSGKTVEELIEAVSKLVIS